MRVGQLPRLSSERCSRSELPKPKTASWVQETLARWTCGQDQEKEIPAGDHRLICDIQDERITILVLELGHRKDAYR